MVSHPPAPFIVGVGRSGTTLLRLMLDAHSQLSIPQETSFLPAAAGLLADEANARVPFFQLVTGAKTWPDFHLDAARLHEALGAIEPFSIAGGVRAFYRVYAERHCKPRFGDKSPSYSVRLTKILAVLPEARFIHLIRDGRDVALSHREVWFGKDQTIDEHVEAWRRRIEKTRELGVQCPHYMEVRYEDLVRHSEAVLRTICAFIELPYEPRMLEYFETARARLDEVTTWFNPDGSARVTKEERLFNQRFTSFPPLESRIFRYRREMSDDVRRRAEAIAGDLLAQFGYETDRALPAEVALAQPRRPSARTFPPGRDEMSGLGASPAPPRPAAVGVSNTRSGHDGPAALVIAHPGHELRVLGWLQIARPTVHILTDGSGHSNQSRIASTERVLTAAGAARGSIFGRLRDRDLYASLLGHDLATFIALADELSAAFAAGRVTTVLGDASEGYNPGHDVCRLIVDAAVARASAASRRPIANFEFPLVSRPDTCDEALRDRAVWLHLDDDAFARKMDTARAYPELADEVERSIASLGIDAFRTECLRPAQAWAPAPGERPFYEVHGANRVAAGHYQQTLRFHEHVRPIALALQDWSRAGANA